ncbi:hypothetical protein [Allokutzneria albata]|uniref:Small subunit ribosomal protein S1 n=1 Tax=Allokutzneria albata TaxID=211114 RepID=A0A1G9TKC0_ALLAB|nr:hypothetical protein [Allokutzneria albata]SDM47854.1 small subunit ribosomal protein S1 [Allokutzneria albata]
MLRDNGVWCRLQVEGAFFIHVGYDQYMYIGSAEPCERAVAITRPPGLFPERISASPYAVDADEAEAQRPADEDFWAELAGLVAMRGTVILEEGYLINASRWHRLRAGDIGRSRAGLTPRARLLVWQELSNDVDAAQLAKAFAEDGHEPVLTAVLPDDDGVLRARWAAC